MPIQGIDNESYESALKKIAEMSVANKQKNEDGKEEKDEIDEKDTKDVKEENEVKEEEEIKQDEREEEEEEEDEEEEEEEEEKKQEETEEENDCCICYELIKETEEMVTNCNHIFHFDCLCRWRNVKFQQYFSILEKLKFIIQILIIRKVNRIVLYVVVNYVIFNVIYVNV